MGGHRDNAAGIGSRRRPPRPGSLPPRPPPGSSEHLPLPGWRRSTNGRTNVRGPISICTRRPSDADRGHLRRRRPRPIRGRRRIPGEWGGFGDHGGGRSLYVSQSGSSRASDRSCRSASYSTIQSAVDAAKPGATVTVCPGTDTEDVIVSSPLTLRGVDATIQGTSAANGNCEQLGALGPGSAPCLAGVTIKSSWVQISGFTVTGATGEGILATGSLESGSISHVTIQDKPRRRQRSRRNSAVHRWRLPAV